MQHFKYFDGRFCKFLIHLVLCHPVKGVRAHVLMIKKNSWGVWNMQQLLRSFSMIISLDYSIHQPLKSCSLYSYPTLSFSSLLVADHLQFAISYWWRIPTILFLKCLFINTYKATTHHLGGITIGISQS